MHPDSTRIRAEFGYAEAIAIDEALRRTVEGEKARGVSQGRTGGAGVIAAESRNGDFEHWPPGRAEEGSKLPTTAFSSTSVNCVANNIGLNPSPFRILCHSGGPDTFQNPASEEFRRLAVRRARDHTLMWITVALEVRQAALYILINAPVLRVTRPSRTRVARKGEICVQ